MKHSACGGWWEIRTDPKNAAYVVVEGARKRDYGPEDVRPGEGEMAFLTEEEREKRRNDAFANFEGKVEEKGAEKRNKERVEELLEGSRVWEDPYTANQKLRREFRVKRKALEKEDKVREGIQDKFSFGYVILDETEMDRVRAKLVEFGGSTGSRDQDTEDVTRKPLFAEKDAVKALEVVPKTKKLKVEILAEQSRQALKKNLVGNTRAAIDPFLMDNTRTNSKPSLGLLKRKRIEDSTPHPVDVSSTSEASTTTDLVDPTPVKKAILPMNLVEYDSD